MGIDGLQRDQFLLPVGVAVDPAGRVSVADAGNDRIQVFTTDGTPITRWGSEGTGDGEFDRPIDLAVNESGAVYVVDERDQRLPVTVIPSQKPMR